MIRILGMFDKVYRVKTISTWDLPLIRAAILYGYKDRFRISVPRRQFLVRCVIWHAAERPVSGRKSGRAMARSNSVAVLLKVQFLDGQKRKYRVKTLALIKKES